MSAQTQQCASKLSCFALTWHVLFARADEAGTSADAKRIAGLRGMDGMVGFKSTRERLVQGRGLERGVPKYVYALLTCRLRVTGTHSTHAMMTCVWVFRFVLDWERVYIRESSVLAADSAKAMAMCS